MRKYKRRKRARRSNPFSRARRHNRVVRHRRYSRRGRRRGRNPGAAIGSLPGRVIGSVKSVYNPRVLMPVGTAVAGYFGFKYLNRLARRYMTFLPATGPAGYAVDLALVGATSALAGGLAGMASPKIGGAVGKSLFAGGMFDVVQRAATQYVVPMIPGMSGFGCVDGMCDLGGLNDYLTPADAASARPLGDYLTPADAAGARPLGEMPNVVDDIGEELAAL